MEVKTKTQSNSKNDDEYAQDENGDIKSEAEDLNNKSETEQHYNIWRKRVPNYHNMNTVGYLNAQVKKDSYKCTDNVF